MIGIIILVLVCLLFLGIGAWIVASIIKGPKFPDGYRFETTFSGKTATLIVDKSFPSLKNRNSNKVKAWVVSGKRIDAKDMVDKCAMAMLATETAFQKIGIDKANRNHVIFLFKTDKNFDNRPSWTTTAAAYSTEISGFFGTKKLDVAVIRTRYLTNMADKGQPAIHELTHMLNKAATGDYSYDHTDPDLWLGPGGRTSVEGEAMLQWVDLVEAFNDE